MENEGLTVLRLRPKPGFVVAGQVGDIGERALCYLNAGYPVHLSGPAGCGKTTLALHLAASLDRPVLLLHGDDEYSGSDLVGAHDGFHHSKVVDNFIHSVMKTEETVQKHWVDNRLTSACKHGLTLVYDEFNRSRPEANNVLLSVLEERVLDLPGGTTQESLMNVHPDFRAIFTSNPEEYAGVHRTQDALLDRMITLRLGHYDRETEAMITAARSGLDQEQSARVVDVVRALRMEGVHNHKPTIRACIILARLCRMRAYRASADDQGFVQLCKDVLSSDCLKVTHEGGSLLSEKVGEVVRKTCGPATVPVAAGRSRATAAGVDAGAASLVGGAR